MPSTRTQKAARYPLYVVYIDHHGYVMLARGKRGGVYTSAGISNAYAISKEQAKLICENLEPGRKRDVHVWTLKYARARERVRRLEAT